MKKIAIAVTAITLATATGGFAQAPGGGFGGGFGLGAGIGAGAVVTGVAALAVVLAIADDKRTDGAVTATSTTTN